MRKYIHTKNLELFKEVIEKSGGSYKVVDSFGYDGNSFITIEYSIEPKNLRIYEETRFKV
jgi:hypothetical protein